MEVKKLMLSTVEDGECQLTNCERSEVQQQWPGKEIGLKSTALHYDREIGATSVLHMLNCATICFETWDQPKPQDSGWNTQLKMAVSPQTQATKLLWVSRM